MFGKVLIANRGEIAVRIAGTLREMGIRVAAVYGEPDRAAPHVACADEAYPLGGMTSAETYLRGDRIIEIARRHEVDAIHPGYGFLSENASFARGCAEAGIVFIGPTAETISVMGDKVTARALMSAAGVPVVPGWASESAPDRDEIAREADRIGYPVLVKAAGGGGGRGMRVVHAAGDLAGAVESAQREAEAAFGDGRVFLERYLAKAQHVEFQVFGDGHGGAVHLFERECSIQRRHQKIIEESPAPGLSDDLRERMGAAAVRAAQAVKYANAGTVEFLLDESGEFFFLEVNTRLQVEHPVTESCLGRDLVRDQVHVAASGELPFTGGDLAPSGHAIECRVYAEDPDRDDLPSTGRIEVYEPPSGPGIRVDSGVTAGTEVSVHFDPMLAKLIASGRTRDEALARLGRAIDAFVVLGVTTNLAFLRRVIDHEAFRSGAVHTRFLDEHAGALRLRRDGAAAGAGVPIEALIAAAAAATGAAPAASRDGRPDEPRSTGHPGPWETAGAWRSA
jgi:3-methylcrotonyl-CoA carboxylase alpha subunit